MYHARDTRAILTCVLRREYEYKRIPAHSRDAAGLRPPGLLALRWLARALSAHFTSCWLTRSSLSLASLDYQEPLQKRYLANFILCLYNLHNDFRQLDACLRKGDGYDDIDDFLRSMWRGE